MTEIKLTETQNDFVSKVENDAFNTNKHIFILKGYAGTGKTVTSSYVAKSDNFKNILIAAPTVMAKNVYEKINSKCRRFKNFIFDGIKAVGDSN